MADKKDNLKPDEKSAGKAPGDKGERSAMKELLSWVEVIVIAVVLAVFIDNVIIINATVPSGSMEKTIMTHSRVLGTRFSYWFGHEPQRGDIVVFRYPIDDAKGKNTHYIKRIIGLPGETIEIKEGAVYVNGEKLEEGYINGKWTVENDGFTFEVPEGEYLMLGDNRNNSNDARYWPYNAIQEGLAATEEEAMQYAFVPRKKILGKAYFCYFPFSDAGSLYSENRGK